jgi:hypothetical protein
MSSPESWNMMKFGDILDTLTEAFKKDTREGSGESSDSHSNWTFSRLVLTIGTFIIIALIVPICGFILRDFQNSSRFQQFSNGGIYIIAVLIIIVGVVFLVCMVLAIILLFILFFFIVLRAIGSLAVPRRSQISAYNDYQPSVIHGSNADRRALARRRASRALGSAFMFLIVLLVSLLVEIITSGGAIPFVTFS